MVGFNQLFNILIVLTIMVALTLIVRSLTKRIVTRSPDYRKLYYLFTSIIVIGGAAYIAYTSGLLEVLIGTLATIGIIGLLLGLALVPWLSDVYAGISLLLDPHVKIGAVVEIGGKRGRIVEITLTRTKLAGEECLIIIPNRKFRDEITVIYSTKTVASPLDEY